MRKSCRAKGSKHGGVDPMALELLSLLDQVEVAQSWEDAKEWALERFGVAARYGLVAVAKEEGEHFIQ